MILQRFFETVLSALRWLMDLLFPHVVLMTILLGLGLGARVLLIVWRSRARSGSPPVRSPAADSGYPPRKRDRPRP
jgi:hypothetical protein